MNVPERTEQMKIRKKYANLCDETHYLQYFKLKKRMYKASVNKNDSVSAKLIRQSAIKSVFAISGIISLVFMLSFQ